MGHHEPLAAGCLILNLKKMTCIQYAILLYALHGFKNNKSTWSSRLFQPVIWNQLQFPIQLEVALCPHVWKRNVIPANIFSQSLVGNLGSFDDLYKPLSILWYSAFFSWEEGSEWSYWLVLTPSFFLGHSPWKWMVGILVSFWGPAYFQGLC